MNKDGSKKLTDKDIEEIIDKKITGLNAERPDPCWFILPRTDWPEELKQGFSGSFNKVIAKFSGDTDDFTGFYGPMMSEFSLDLLFNFAVMENIEKILEFFIEKEKISKKGYDEIKSFFEFLNGGFYCDCRDGGVSNGPECNDEELDPLTGELLNASPACENDIIDILKDMKKWNAMCQNEWLYLDLIWGDWHDNKEVNKLVRAIIEKHGGVE